MPGYIHGVEPKDFASSSSRQEDVNVPSRSPSPQPLAGPDDVHFWVKGAHGLDAEGQQLREIKLPTLQLCGQQPLDTKMGNFISWLNTNVPVDQKGGDAQTAKTNQPQSLWGHERSPELPRGFFNWFGSFWKIPDAYSLTHQTLDAYLFLRYLKVCTVVCFVSACITWPILFPVNATGKGGQGQLEILSYSNVNVDKSPNYFFAHALVAWAVYGFLMYMITRECIFFINLRQAYLLTPHYAKRISARTVLFTAVPQEYLDEAKIRQIFNNAVKNVWIAGNTKELDEKVEERDKVAMKLEGAEVKLIVAVNKARAKALKKGGNASEPEQDAETANVISRWLPDKKRPSHRLGPLGLVGKKVDTLTWCRSELEKSIPEIRSAQAAWKEQGNFTKVGALFVEFHTQADAQAAYQVITHHQALHMSPKAIGLKPNDVIWKNLSIPWWQLIIRRYAVYAIIAAMIIFWAIPVGIVGIISQVKTLESLPGLTWINDIPEKILGFISGLLPSVALAILMSLVPVIMRALARVAGAKSNSEAELFTQNSYFVFQVIQVFLWRSVSDAASAAIVKISQDPSQVFTILGSTLPTTSNFYISYFIVQGITIAVGTVTQVVGLFVFRILYKFLTSTPRAKYRKWTTLSAILWGSLLPVYTNIVCISIIYSVIAPLILFWSTLALFLFHLAYKYNLLFVSDTAVDTQGLIYPRALKQLFTGIYIGEIVMVGMFAVVKAPGPAILMAVFLVFTILYHITMTRSIGPLLQGLPRTLEAHESLVQGNVGGTEAAKANVAGATSNSAPGTNGGESTDLKKATSSSSNDYGVQKPKCNIFTRFLKPWIFSDYNSLRHMVPQEQDIDFAHLQASGEVFERDAYFPPSVNSEPPQLWIPEDSLGVSKHEITLTSKVIPISDKGAHLDEKNNVVWSENLSDEADLPPIYEPKTYY
ncbi:hypothetical protein UVI_02043550 [Ustilaginoidea virens]|uniref:DUF221 domain-containing protein n=1 Tax=Ustilaginoidea virens TaxID=1159556 RepID=A0A1B5KXE4_USTVR|nr:hypothetical protein UVI_02043550 [Ustilaginoidea virens]